MKRSIVGEHALVTGGVQGIGAATVRRLLQAGAVVTVLDRDPPPADATTDNDDLVYLQCDVSQATEVARALSEATNAHGPVDILINNAGVMFPGNFLDKDFGSWQKTIDVNLTATLRLCYLLLPEMIAAGKGTIVNVASASSCVGVPGLAVYSASKWGVWGLTEARRGEVRNLGAAVHIASIHPNFLRTGLFEGAHLSGVGGLIVPRVRSHDVIARAIVDSAVRRRRGFLLRPRSVKLAVLFRGLLPDPWFQWVSRVLGVAGSMSHLGNAT